MSSIISRQPPALAPEIARALLHEHFGIDGDLSPLPSERDQNYRVNGGVGGKWVFKIATPDEDAALGMQCDLLRYLEQVDPSFPVPRVHATVTGDSVASAMVSDRHYRLRVVSWLDGEPLAGTPRSPQQLQQLGRTVGRLACALRAFGHPAAHRYLDWDLSRTLESRSRLTAVVDPEQRQLIETALLGFEHHVVARLHTLRHSIVHGDPNDWNILVNPSAPEQITGLIDLGDAVFSMTVADLAIACAYAIMGTPAPLVAASTVIGAFHAEFALEAAEIEVLLDAIRGRLCTSLTIAASRRAPGGVDNQYWFVSQEPALALLRQLGGVNRHHAAAIFREACGLAPAARGQAITRWIERKRGTLSPILPVDLARYTKQRLNWSDPLDPVVLSTATGDTAAADAAYSALAARDGFSVGIGAWGEARAIYTAAAFDSTLLPGARRSVHLGLDIFVDAGTPLRTPMAGRVLGWADSNRPQDYGGVLLLEHHTDEGETFASLWGHLAPSSLAEWRVGDLVTAGDVVATLGNSAENGGWVPHLHLQLVCSGETNAAGIIGVGEAELMSLWSSLYPDPITFAGLPPETLECPPPISDLLARRQARLGHNLSLSYRQPLHIVRGEDVWLFDASGRAYLDCYNNVAHVGHSHPRVVAAIARQAARLNTNTRYLHENILDYADRLTAVLPAPLRVCFFTCSGSEANELALRMARAYTHRRDVVVLDMAYHGSTSGLVEISPYKYKRHGGQGRAGHVHEIAVPDPYRAPADWPRHEVGARYAALLDPVLAGLPAPGCLIAETIPSCAGQIFLPSGFLGGAFAKARAAGALCILDEVQVGFGRVGSAMWAFEEHGVVPDILTLGKPIGNGHPMGAVVTTMEVAAAFADGPEYFNTFGGNPVSCAAGLAVLDVLHDQQLLRNAQVRGGEILQGLRELQGQYANIGDVRGRGLFIGVELVTDRETKVPATDLANRMVNRCRLLGVLLGTDGPHDNVLKVRPPMTFSHKHVRQLLEVLTEAFRLEA